jgi:heme exporter protein D
MNYFLKFLETTDHVPYVLSSYFVVFVILIIISVNSLKKLKKLENEIVNLTKNEKKKIKDSKTFFFS